MTLTGDFHCFLYKRSKLRNGRAVKHHLKEEFDLAIQLSGKAKVSISAANVAHKNEFPVFFVDVLEPLSLHSVRL